MTSRLDEGTTPRLMNNEPNLPSGRISDLDLD